MALPNVRDVEIFTAIAEELSFRRAAERLFMDQSTLSRRLAHLEEIIGFDLVFRTTRDVQLTEAGRVFYARAVPLLRGFAQSVEAARAAAAGKTGQLRLAYMSFVATDILPISVQRYTSQFPDVALELQQMNTQAQRLALFRGEIDTGFMLGPFDNPHFAQKLIRRERLVAIMPEAHCLAQQDAVTLADLAKHRFILGSHEQWDFFRILVDGIFSTRQLTLQLGHQPSDAMGLIGLVASGLGLSVYVEGITRLSPPNVACRPIADCDTLIETILCWDRGNTNPALRHFVDAVK